MKGKYNRIIGRVIYFDGNAGIIKSQLGNHIFTKYDLTNNTMVEKDTIVEFVSNTNIFGNEKTLVAHYINIFSGNS